MVFAYFHALVSIFAVMNPLGIMPTFLALTSGYRPTDQRNVAKKSIINAFFILVAFLLLGNVILQMFSITIHAFRVAGGILLFGIAYNLLNAKQSHIQSPYDDEQQVPMNDITVTPLAIPIIAGPGTITTVMALSAGQHVVTSSIVVFLAFCTVLAVAYTIFYNAPHINRRLSQVQLNVITRLMGFLLSIIAVQMAASGLAGLFPAWTR